MTIGLILILVTLVVGLIWVALLKLGTEVSLMWTAIIGGIGWLIKTNVERKSEYRRILAEEKRKLYFDFIESLLPFLNSSDSEKGVEIDKSEWRRWSLRLALVASDDVLRAWNTFRLAAVERDQTGHEPETAEALKDLGRFLLAMRKDCGHADSRLKRWEVLSLILNDAINYRDKLEGP